MTDAIGSRRWVLSDGYIPGGSTGRPPAMLNHEAICILNTGSEHVRVVLMHHFEDRAPVGPYDLRVAAQRKFYQRFNGFREPEAVPRGRGYACSLGDGARRRPADAARFPAIGERPAEHFGLSGLTLTVREERPPSAGSRGAERSVGVLPE